MLLRNSTAVLKQNKRLFQYEGSVKFLPLLSLLPLSLLSDFVFQYFELLYDSVFFTQASYF